jgi:hypothetical protein
MPLADYICPACTRRFEEFHHHPPESRPCPAIVPDLDIDNGRSFADGTVSPASTVCGTDSPRHFSLPGEYRPSAAQRFDPILIHQSLDNPAVFSFPGHNQDETPAGYRAVRINTLQEADRWTKHINNIETSVLRQQKQSNVRGHEMQQAATRRAADEQFKRLGLDQIGAARLIRDRVREHLDKKRAAKAHAAERGEANFRIQVFVNDASNRNPHASERTGWKERKG